MTRTTRTLLLGATLLAVAAAALCACGSDQAQPEQYQGVCVDPNTQVRLDDSQCRGNGGGSGGSGGMGVMEWLLLSQAIGSHNQPVYLPPVGGRISRDVHVYHHLSDLPRGASVNTAPAPRAGGYATFNGGKPAYSTKKPIWVEPPAAGSKPDTKPSKQGFWSRLKGGSSGGSKSGGGSRSYRKTGR